MAETWIAEQDFAFAYFGLLFVCWFGMVLKFWRNQK